MKNQLLQLLLNQAKTKSPQVFQAFEQMRSGNSNPVDIFKQVTSKFTPEQMNGLYNQAKSMGFPPEVLSQVQNGINSK